MSQRDDLIRAYTTHYDMLLAFVERRVQSRELAADIVQDIYLRIATHDSAVPVENPLAFFYRVAGNLIIDRLREQAVRARHDDPDSMAEDVADNAPGSEAQIAGQQRLQLLSQAISELPARCREVFILRKIEHLEFDDIARRMGISRNMVEKHLRKALLHCQTRLQEHE